MKLTPHRLAHRLVALLLAAGVGGFLGVGSAQPWHRHLLAGLQLFHSHSHLGDHHHEELHSLADGLGRAPAEHAHADEAHGHASRPAGESEADPHGSDESEEGPRPESDCVLVASGLASLARSSAEFVAPSFAAQRRDEVRPTVFRPGEPAAHSGARAPPA